MGTRCRKRRTVEKVDKRSETSDGWTYTFAEFSTCKTIKIVLPKRLNVQLMGAYKLGGLGYDIKAGNMYFIEKTRLSQITKFDDIYVIERDCWNLFPAGRTEH